MITQLIISFFFGIVDLLINLIPTITFPESLTVGMNDVSELMGIFAYFIPIGTFSLCLSIIFILQNARFIVSIFNFIVRKIPGLN